jgi:DNA polymerase-3 subunit epsilon
VSRKKRFTKIFQREPENFVVVDCETTGFGRKDRIVEVALVVVDSLSLEIVDEYETLVNPERDPGPVGVHGVTPTMLEAAPNFGEVAAALSRRLNGSVFVAHNLAFDSRMLGQEFSRLGVGFDAGSGFCTLRATSEKLNVACERFGIELSSQHRALADARATASLLRNVLDRDEQMAAVSVGFIDLPANPRTLRREINNNEMVSEMVRVISLAHYPYSDEALLQYLDTLDWALDDLVISEVERAQMDQLASELGISPEQQDRAHRQYLRSIISAARRDAIVTEAEQQLISQVAAALGIMDEEIPEVTETLSLSSIEQGSRICFTGTAIVDGEQLGRTELEELATEAGLQPVANVSKKGCDVLVAADPSSMSGKAKKARGFDIPIVSIDEFLEGLV